MPNPSHPNEIPVPTDSSVLDQYLALGWYRLDDPPRLRWSIAAGRPRHPGDKSDPPVNFILRILDVALLHELERYAPLANSFKGECFEVRAVLSVKFQKIKQHSRRRCTPPLMSWKAVDASLNVLSNDERLINENNGD